ncbi:MAG: FAD-dependent monooxygenase [Bacteroidota bacterium]
MAQVKTAVVVGAGIGGLTAALALHRQGVRVNVFERAEQFGEVGAGISLWPNATRVLNRLGVLEAIDQRGARLNYLGVCDADGRVLMRVPTDQYEVPSLCAYRPDLVEALRSALPEGTVHLGHTLTAVEEHDNQAVASFANGATAAADILVGADGIRSVVRAATLGHSSPQYRGYPVWRGISPVPDGWEQGRLTESWGNGKRFGLVPTGEGRMYWYATANVLEGSGAADAVAEKARVAALFARWHEPIPVAIAATPARAVLYNDTYDLAPSRPWYKGRTVLIGDAIHATTPNLGQGGCTAIEDGWMLAKLLQAQPYAQAFAAFERARYRRTTRVTKQSLLIGRVGQWEGRAARARNAVTRRFPGSLYASGTRWLFNYGR